MSDLDAVLSELLGDGLLQISHLHHNFFRIPTGVVNDISQNHRKIQGDPIFDIILALFF